MIHTACADFGPSRSMEKACRRSAAPEGLLDFYVVVDATTAMTRLEALEFMLLCELEDGRRTP